MSIFLCNKSTEQEVGLLSQYQTQKHGILSFSRKPIGSWIEIHISIESSLFDQSYKYGRFDIFDVLSLTDEVSLHCYFASFEEGQAFLPKDKECLFSVQIPIKQTLENISNNKQEKLVQKISEESIPKKEPKKEPHNKERSLAIEPANINPLLSMLAIDVAPKDCEILVSSEQVLINASGVSMRLVMSLNVIPSIGKSLTVLMYCFRLSGSFMFLSFH